METFKLITWNVNSVRIRLELLKKLIETEKKLYPLAKKPE